MDNEIFYTKFDSKIGVVILVGNQDGLMNLELEKHDGMRKFKLEATWIRNDDFFHEIIKQLKEYFSGTRKRFERIKINFQGTEYQQKVWKQLMEIPYGECWSYKDVAIAIGNPKASRAVGMANSKNKPELRSGFELKNT